MYCPVSQSYDACLALGFASPHDYFPAGPCPPLPLPSPIGMAFDLPTTVWWPGGAALGKNKLTETVKHNEWSFALEGHDVGPLIVHVQIAPHPANALTVLHILKSKRKANFSAGEVKAEGKPVGHLLALNPGLVPTPMSVCGKPISPPTGCTAIMSAFNDLLIGVHPVDLAAGWVSIAVGLVLDLAKSAAGTPGSGWEEAGKELGNWASDLLGDPFGDPPSSGMPGSGKFVRSNAPSVAAGLIRLAGQELFDYHGDARVGINVGNNAYQVGFSYRRDGVTGRSEAGLSEEVRGPMGVGQAGLEQGLEWGGGEPVEGSAGGSAGIGALDVDGDLDFDGSGADDDGWTSL